MQEKDIKRLVTKQLKKEFPRFRRLTKKQKKVLVEQDNQMINFFIFSRFSGIKKISGPAGPGTGAIPLPPGH